MKHTSHIKKLAKKLHKADCKRGKYPMEEGAFADELTLLRNALLRGRFYVGVDSVSKSGMSRTLTLAYCYKNQINKVWNPLVLGLAGCNPSGRIAGGGMDMCFAAQYNLFCSLFRSYKEAHYQKRMPTYNSL